MCGAAELASFSPTYVSPLDATPRLTISGTALRGSYNVVLTQGVGCGGVGAASDVDVSEVAVNGAFTTLTTDVGASGLVADSQWSVCVALYVGSPWYAVQSTSPLVVRCVRLPLLRGHSGWLIYSLQLSYFCACLVATQRRECRSARRSRPTCCRR